MPWIRAHAEVLRDRGSFPFDADSFPPAAISYVAEQVKVDPAEFAKYPWSGRTIKYHRAQIREAFGFREATRADEDRLTAWLAEEVCPVELRTVADVTPMKRVAAACLVGSAVELYDFFIYGTAAALVFPTVFFPHLSAAMANIASMGTFATAFLSRPLGAVVFGYFGDRLGRKKTLVATLLIMALSTVAVGLVPSTAAIGVAAPLMFER